MANEKITLVTTGGNKEVIAKDGFSPSAFICNASGKLEPTVYKSGVLSGNGSFSNPLIVSAGGANQVLKTVAGVASWANNTPITPTDTNSVDLTVGGTDSHTIQADVKISATAGNQISILGDGLYAAGAAAQTPITVVDTASVNLTASGAFNTTLQADVKVSAFPGNQISIQGDGIFSGTDAAGAVGTTPSGADLLQHGAVDGAVFQWSQGIGNFNFGADPCQNVGTFRMVRAISMSGNTLNIQSAPEHVHRVFTFAGAFGPDFADIRPVAVYGLNTLIVTINNPSGCRSFEGRTILQGFCNIQMEDSGRFNYGIQNAPAFVGPYTYMYNGAKTTVVRINETMHLEAIDNLTLAAGASSTKYYRWAVETTNAPAAGTNALTNGGIGAGSFSGGTL